MNWIKIEPRCELPNDGERLLILNSAGWEEAEWSKGHFSVPVTEEEIRDVTHFMRVTLPA
jgi:hypothetical protein